MTLNLSNDADMALLEKLERIAIALERANELGQQKDELMKTMMSLFHNLAENYMGTKLQ